MVDPNLIWLVLTIRRGGLDTDAQKGAVKTQGKTIYKLRREA